MPQKEEERPCWLVMGHATEPIELYEIVEARLRGAPVDGVQVVRLRFDFLVSFPVHRVYLSRADAEERLAELIALDAGMASVPRGPPARS